MSTSLRDLIKQRDSAKTTGASSYIAMLDKHLTSAPKKPRRKGYHPSDLSYNFCPRFYALVGLDLLIRQKDVDARLQRIFDNGHGLHDRYQRYAREMGLPTTVPEIVARGAKVGKGRVAQEVRLDHPVGITGNADNVFEIDGFLEVPDYKSINTYKFKTLMEPIDYHEKQLTVYLGMVDHIFGGNPPKPLRGRMIYEDKDTQDLKEFVVPWDAHHQELFASLVRYLEIVNQAVNQNTPELAPCLCGKCETAYNIESLRQQPLVVKI